jgi:membrane fusion protein, peptide pheromone/bacteriocin exporter
LSSLKNEQLKTCSETMVSLNQKKDENNLNINNLKEEMKNLELRAPVSGFVHIVEPDKQTDLVGTGTALAQIYPALKRNQLVKLKAYISPNEISSIHKGQILRMKIVRNVPTPIVVEGKIKTISVAPVIVNNANYYVVEAFAQVNGKQIDKLHYGMTGQGTVITGRQSFFTYYKNRLFNHDPEN